MQHKDIQTSIQKFLGTKTLPENLTIKQCSRILCLTPGKLELMLTEGELPSINTDNETFIPTPAVIEMLAVGARQH